jgi:hypothetical protein
MQLLLTPLQADSEGYGEAQRDAVARCLLSLQQCRAGRQVRTFSALCVPHTKFSVHVKAHYT